jgi:hypothetical protein
MSENVETAVLEILKRIQTDVGDVKEHVIGLEGVVRKMRQDNAGMLVMMRATAGHFEARFSDLEDKVARLERAGS